MFRFYIHGDEKTVNGLYEHVLNSTYQDYRLQRRGKVLMFSINKDNKEPFIVFLATMIANYITETMELDVIRNVVDFEYPEMLGEDEAWLIAKAHQETVSDGYRESLVDEIGDLLHDEYANKHFDLEGFVTFRLRQRTTHVIETIISVVENYLLDSDEMQFTKMLARFINMQVPKYDVLDIILFADKSYEFVLNGNTRVETRSLGGLLQGLNAQNPQGEITEDNIFLSVVLNIAPKNIVVHTYDDNHNSLVELITRVYGGRSSICMGCELCDYFHHNHPE